MKKALLLLAVLFVALASCKKDKVDNDAQIQAYIKANNINATRDDSGLYYQIITPGSGNNPTVNNNITVTYTGKLLDGTTFDSGTLTNNPLSQLIKGWQIGIPKIKTGGQILLLVPSSLGYGDTAQGSIPANSALVFTVTLTSFK